MSIQKYRVAAVLVTIFLIAGFMRLNDLSLYTDSTRYLLWGNSLAHFQGYVDETRPVPSRFVMNAPLYPLLLAPVEVIFPASLNAAKIWTLLWAAVGLLLFFLWLKSHFGNAAALAASFMLAFNPLFLVLSTEVLSEAPFLVFSIVILWTFERFVADRVDARTRWGLILSLALITLLREVGAAFVLASLIVLFRRKNGREFIIIAASAILLFLAWSVRNFLAAGNEPGESANMQFLFGRFLTGTSDSIVSEFEARFWLNLKGYLIEIGGAIFHPSPQNLVAEPSGFYQGLQVILEMLRPFAALAAAGLVLYGMKLDDPKSPAGLFRLISFFIYWLIILVYPVHDIRFLLPLLPLVLFYILKSYQGLATRIADPWRARAGIGLTMIFLAPNVATDYEILRTNAEYRSTPAEFSHRSADASWFGQPWSLMGQWIEEHLPKEAILASPAKEIAAFVGERKVLETSRILPTPIFERIIRDHAAGYLLTTIAWDDMETFEIAMMETRRMWFEPLYSVANLAIYRIHWSLLEPPPAINSPNPDTSSVKGKILAGRLQLQKLQYDRAVGLLHEAMQMAPSQPEPVFQLMTTLSILGDSASTMELNTRLFTLPQSTAYSQLAQANIGAMEQLLRAERQAFPQRSYTAFEAGLAYWSLGYRSTGLAVMRNISKSDTTHFSAPLWGCYYAKQLGDTLESNEFLKRVKKIDFTAPITDDWESMRQLENQLKTTASTQGKAKLHLRISRIYSRLELYDEALDALERAMFLDPTDIDLLLARADVFEKKRARFGAAKVYERVLDLEPHNSFARERLDSLAIAS